MLGCPAVELRGVSSITSQRRTNVIFARPIRGSKQHVASQGDHQSATEVAGNANLHVSGQTPSISNGVANGPHATPALPTMQQPVAAVLSPQANYQNIVSIGTYKGTQHPGKIFLQGIQAGAYIAFGAFLMLAMGGKSPGLMASNYGLHKLICALVFPVGLLMVMLGGADLYTGNTFVVPVALWEKKVTFPELLKSFVCSYMGNLVGSLLMVLAVTCSGVLEGNFLAVYIAETKTGLPLGQVIVRAILANWLVCVAVFHANAASSLPGKLLGLWPPISAFVAIGLEHSVANMFLIPMGMVVGAKVTAADFLLKNLIPVTLGNTIAGVVCMAALYAACFGSASKTLFPATRVP